MSKTFSRTLYIAVLKVSMSNLEVSVANFSKGILLSFFLSFGVLQAREARSIFVQPPQGAPEKAYLVTNTQSIQVDLPTRNFSSEVSLPAGDLTFAVLPKPLEQGQEIPENAPIVRVPKEWSRCYLLFVVDKKNEFFPVRVLPINASGNGFPEGHYQMLNASNATIRARFGKQVVVVKPGKISLVEPPINEFGSYPIRVDCLKPGEKEPSVICQSMWQHDPSARQLVLVTTSPTRSLPRIWALTDVPTPKDDA